MTRDEWVRARSSKGMEGIRRRREIIVRCPELGEDGHWCQGWIAITDHEFDDLDPWTPDEITEARAYRDRMVTT